MQRNWDVLHFLRFDASIALRQLASQVLVKSYWSNTGTTFWRRRYYPLLAL